MPEAEIYPKGEFVRRVNTVHSKVRIEHTTWSSGNDTFPFEKSANIALWQMRHQFNPRKRENDYQQFSILTVLPLRSMSILRNPSSL